MEDIQYVRKIALIIVNYSKLIGTRAFIPAKQTHIIGKQFRYEWLVLTVLKLEPDEMIQELKVQKLIDTTKNITKTYCIVKHLITSCCISTSSVTDQLHRHNSTKNNWTHSINISDSCVSLSMCGITTFWRWLHHPKWNPTKTVSESSVAMISCRPWPHKWTHTPSPTDSSAVLLILATWLQLLGRLVWYTEAKLSPFLNMAHWARPFTDMCTVKW